MEWEQYFRTHSLVQLGVKATVMPPKERRSLKSLNVAAY